MTYQELPNSFKPSVELAFANPSYLSEKSKDRRVTLVARFRDFLGETSRSTGRLRLSTSFGTLTLPNGGVSGTEIEFEQGEVPLSESGELAIVFDPGKEFGDAEVKVECDLGSADLKVLVAAPTGFALAEMMESIIYAFLVAIVIRIFFFQTFWIPSGSMEPTLYEGDRIIANKLVYRIREPNRGEVIIFRVFQPPRRSSHGRLTLEEATEAAEEAGDAWFQRVDENGITVMPPVEVQDYIKRVVGLPGDIVEISGGEIFINGEVLYEGFESRPPDYDRYGPITVPQGEVFVLGDNRANSQDSHVIGTIPIRNIEGRAEVVFWPPGRIGLITRGH